MLGCWGVGVLYQISKPMTDIHARMLAKPAFVVTQIKKNGISPVIVIIPMLMLTQHPTDKVPYI